MSNSVFISYAHKDMTPTNWLDKLKNYLAAFQQKGEVDVWDDTRLEPGQDWHHEIEKALDEASVAVLLVGPGFLGSDFITKYELPPLLDAAKYRGKKIFPLIIGFCAWEQSTLKPYQVVNDPNEPLEALPPHEQNRILNELSILIAREVDKVVLSTQIKGKPVTEELVAAAKQILRNLEDTYTAFQAQARLRNDLVKRMKERLNIVKKIEYEEFFYKYYNEMNSTERFSFLRIRAVTEGTLHDGNRNTLEILNNNLALLDMVPALTDLRQHLVYWINKYDKIFTKTEEMCLLYVGVEDAVPFPNGIEHQIQSWLKKEESA